MLSDAEILNIVGQELSQSAGGNENEFIDSNRKDALSFYLGSKLGNEVEGRSQVVSTDVADSIEWILPEIMEQLSKSDEIVTFDAVNAEDEDSAMMESRFVYEVLMKENDGFLILHQVIKDALMQKNGIIKTWYEVDNTVEVERYTGLNDAELQYLQKDPEREIKEQTDNVDQQATQVQMEQYEGMVMQLQQQMQQMQMQMQQMPPEQQQQAGMQLQQIQQQLQQPPPEPIMMYDVMVHVNKSVPKIRVAAVPPEEFRINRQHNTPNPKDARFTAHVLLKTASDLIESGIPAEVVRALPRGEAHDDDRDYRFYMQNETVYPDREVSNDRSQDMIEIAECFMHIDIDEDGVAEFMKIEVAGGDNPTNILRMEQLSVHDHPFNSAIAIMMSHKFFGLSIYDRLKQIQEQKTTLWRNILDNIYLQNNQRYLVMENQVNIDDLLISRPGGIIRQYAPNSVEPLVTPPLGEDAYNMMEYLDQVRAGRVGVNPEGPLNIQDIGNRVGSQGVAQLLTAREAVVGLIIRVIAETGVKPLMLQIRDIARTRLDTIQDFKFKNSWRSIRPTDWRTRTKATVRVGTGSGNNTAQLQTMAQILEMQTAVQSEPGQTLVDNERRFAAIKKFCNLSGLGDAGIYFLDPRSDQGMQAAEQSSQIMQKNQQKEEENRQTMNSMQSKLADAEVGKAQAAMETVKLKGQIDSLKLQLDEGKVLLQNAQSGAAQEFDYDKLVMEEAMALTKLETEHALELSKMHLDNKKEVDNSNG